MRQYPRDSRQAANGGEELLLLAGGAPGCVVLSGKEGIEGFSARNCFITAKPPRQSCRVERNAAFWSDTARSAFSALWPVHNDTATGNRKNAQEIPVSTGL